MLVTWLDLAFVAFGLAAVGYALWRRPRPPEVAPSPPVTSGELLLTALAATPAAVGPNVLVVALTPGMPTMPVLTRVALLPSIGLLALVWLAARAAGYGRLANRCSCLGSAGVCGVCRSHRREHLESRGRASMYRAAVDSGISRWAVFHRERGATMKETHEITLEVRGMTCDHCERTVTKALQSVPGVTEVLEVSHRKGEARIVAGEQASRARIEGAVQRAGYRARVREDAEPTV